MGVRSRLMHVKLCQIFYTLTRMRDTLPCGTLAVSEAGVVSAVVAGLALTPSVVRAGARRALLLVVGAEAAAVLAAVDVVPDLREVVLRTGAALGLDGRGAVRDQVLSRGTHVAHQGLARRLVLPRVGASCGRGAPRDGAAQPHR